MGVDTQRCGRLGVAQETGHRCHVRTARNQKAGVAVTERMHVQLFRETVLFQNQLEPPCESAGRHRVLAVVLAEHKIIGGQLSILVSVGLPDAFPVILFQ